MSNHHPYFKPTKTVRWIRRDGAVVMQQWYEDPRTPPSLAELSLMGEWCAGEWREEITPLLSEEV